MYEHGYSAEQICHRLRYNLEDIIKFYETLKREDYENIRSHPTKPYK